jgi:quinolinate synthase
MIQYVDQERPGSVVMITECSMSDNVAVEFPDVQFIRPCNLCPHMKRITLPNILASLQELKFEIEVDMTIATRALSAVRKMLEFSK